jgi:HNH endonuclease
MTVPIEDRIVDHFILMHKPEHHRAFPSGYVTEQVLIAESYLGRELFPDEEVRHINGKPHDNRPENLRVTSGSYKSVSLTMEVEQNVRASKIFIPCKFQKICWDTIRAPKARKHKIFLPYVCSYQSDGDVYMCGNFWSFREGEKEI